MARWHKNLLRVFLVATLVGCSRSSSREHAATDSGLWAPGAYAATFLRDGHFSSLAVDVYWARGVEPDPAALAFLQLRLAQHTRKPGGVTVALAREVDVYGTSVWSLNACLKADTEIGEARESPPVARIHIIYLPGGSDRDLSNPAQPTLGLGVTGSSFVVFKQSILATREGAGTHSELEGAVLVHEAGHLLGLVRRGAPLRSEHEDPYSANHCTTPGCVMQASSDHWTIADGAADYCSACVLDIEGLGGR